MPNQIDCGADAQKRPRPFLAAGHPEFRFLDLPQCCNGRDRQPGNEQSVAGFPLAACCTKVNRYVFPDANRCRPELARAHRLVDCNSRIGSDNEATGNLQQQTPRCARGDISCHSERSEESHCSDPCARFHYRISCYSPLGGTALLAWAGTPSIQSTRLNRRQFTRTPPSCPISGQRIWAQYPIRVRPAGPGIDRHRT